MMFLQVYYHDIRRIYDILLTNFIKELLPKLNKGDEGAFYPKDLNQFIKHDDHLICQKLLEFSDSSETDTINILARLIIKRKHLQCIKERIIYHNEEKPDIKKFKNNYNDLKRDYPNLIFDKASDVPNKFSAKDIEFYYKTEYRYERESDNYKDIKTRTKLISAFDFLDILRIYAPRELSKNDLSSKMGSMSWEG
jgi:HD superfamily phosphohydrolase